MQKVIDFLKNHKWPLICIAVGAFGGFWGVCLGFLVGFFIDRLLARKREDEQLIEKMTNPFAQNAASIDEPFDGASLVANLAVNIAGTSSLAAREIEFIFGKEFKTDWNLLCRAAFKAQNTNSDLLTECLAAKLTKAKNPHLTEQIFKLFTTLEYGWDDRIGNRPSVYLAEFLNYTVNADEEDAAYRILGVKKTDSVRTIKSVYRTLVRSYHPDTLKDLSEQQKKVAEEAFIRIQKAYTKIISLVSP